MIFSRISPVFDGLFAVLKRVGLQPALNGAMGLSIGPPYMGGVLGPKHP